MTGNYKVGDIVYKKNNDNKFWVYKILKILKDSQGNIFGYGVLSYFPSEVLPKIEDLNGLDNVQIYFTPLSNTEFDCTVLGNKRITEEELTGYYIYLDEQGIYDKKVVDTANKYFHEAESCYKGKEFSKAIDKYTEVIHRMPSYYIAIDKRAFCKMDMGKWDDAIKDLQLSLSIKSDNLVATFSMGECLIRKRDYENAIKYFKKALEIDPNDVQSKAFLEQTIKHLKRG